MKVNEEFSLADFDLRQTPAFVLTENSLPEYVLGNPVDLATHESRKPAHSLPFSKE
jgi:hypothetical protein